MSDSSDFGTPRYILDAARKAMGGDIYLDPFSSTTHNSRVEAIHYITKKQNSLTLDWNAKTVFMHAPYELTDRALHKLVYRSRFEDAVCFLPAELHSQWCQTLVWDEADVVCFPGSVLLLDQLTYYDGVAYTGQCDIRQQSIIAYYGADKDRAVEAFRPLGVVFKEWIKKERR